MKIIIPARGGSKRIPNKNVKLLNGKPLISYAIETCLKVTSDVYVSTDCATISDVSISFGAKVIDRPTNLATDTSRTEDTIEHFLETVDSVEDFACVQATTPMLDSISLREGFNLLGVYDSVISVSEKTEYLWDEYHKPMNFNKLGRPRTQDMNKVYSENGAFYITSKESFVQNKCLYDGTVGFVMMNSISSLEIDTIDDWEFVVKCMK
jgi:N-acylneuraminate cytidylyltransferase